MPILDKLSSRFCHLFVPNKQMTCSSDERINTFSEKLFRIKAAAYTSRHKNFLVTRSDYLALGLLHAGEVFPEIKNLIKEFLCMDGLSDGKMHAVLHRVTQCGLQQFQLIATVGNTHFQEKTKTHLEKYRYEHQSFSFPHEIPNWVNQRVCAMTKESIPSIISQTPIGLELFLASIACMELAWKDPFVIKEQMFRNSDNTCSFIPMMCQYKKTVKMAFGLSITILKLPLKNEWTMYLVRPSIAEANMEIAILRLNVFMSEFSDFLKNPIFKTKTPSEIGIPCLDLEEESNILQEIGDTNLGKQLTQLQGIELFSKSKIKIDELEGKVSDFLSVDDPDAEYDPPFLLDRPSAFAIVNEKTNVIITMGQLLKMREEELSFIGGFKGRERNLLSG